MIVKIEALSVVLCSDVLHLSTCPSCFHETKENLQDLKHITILPNPWQEVDTSSLVKKICCMLELYTWWWNIISQDALHVTESMPFMLYSPNMWKLIYQA